MLLNVLIDFARLNKIETIVVASTGIASIMLHQGILYIYNELNVLINNRTNSTFTIRSAIDTSDT